MGWALGRFAPNQSFSHLLSSQWQKPKKIEEMATHLYPKYSTFNPLTTNAESYSNLPESFTTDYSNFSMSIKLFYLREKKPVDALSCTGIRVYKPNKSNIDCDSFYTILLFHIFIYEALFIIAWQQFIVTLSRDSWNYIRGIRILLWNVVHHCVATVHCEAVER